MATQFKPTQVLLKNVQLSYPSLHQKTKNFNQKDVFKVTMLIDKDTNEIDKVNQAIVEAIKWRNESKGENTTISQMKYLPVKDGDDYKDKEGNTRAEYANKWYLTFEMDELPELLDVNNLPVLNGDQVKDIFTGGSFAHAFVDIFSYYHPTFKVRGVKGRLLKLRQSAKPAEPFGAPQLSADDVFGDLD